MRRGVNKVQNVYVVVFHASIYYGNVLKASVDFSTARVVLT